MNLSLVPYQLGLASSIREMNLSWPRLTGAVRGERGGKD